MYPPVQGPSPPGQPASSFHGSQNPSQFPQPQQPAQYGQYGQPGQQYVPHDQQYQAPMYSQPPFMPQPYQQQAYPAQEQATAPQAGFMPNLSPLNFMSAGSLLAGGQQWGQQYVQSVQQKMGWLSGGGGLSFYFSIGNSYVTSKLLMLMAPYLRRWTFTRQPEQISGGQRFRPPRVDVNSPDLYLPVMAVWSYVLLLCVVSLLHQKYKPDLMYTSVSSALMAWGVHVVVVWLLLRAMNQPMSIPWVELLAFTGYTFVPACITIVAGLLAGKWGYYAAWTYGSLCMGIFLVRTIKRILFQEPRNYGRDLTMTNYLLLALAMFQFPWGFWLTNLPLTPLIVLPKPTLQ